MEDNKRFGINDSKYRLVRPRDDGNSPRIYPAESFFALLQQDALGVMTLRSYASNCLQILDWGRDPVTGAPLTTDQRQHLTALADDVSTRADKWAEQNLHLPD